MRDLFFDIPHGREALYLRIAKGIRAAIAGGRLAPGEKLPPTRELAEMTSTHRNTVFAALNELEAEGWIHGEQRKAYRVVDPPPNRFFAPPGRNGACTEEAAAPGAAGSSKTFEWSFAREVRLSDFAPGARVRQHEARRPRQLAHPVAAPRDPLAQGAGIALELAVVEIRHRRAQTDPCLVDDSLSGKRQGRHNLGS